MEPRFFDTDEQLLRAVMDWSFRRIVGGQDPQAGSRSAEELDQGLLGSINSAGIGGLEALRRFTQTIVPATRAQGHPMNLAYVPSAPTPASLTFDLAVSAAEVFAGTWEAGAGAVHAENQALDWLAELARWPDTAGGAFVQGGTIGNLSALATARHRASQRGDRGSERWMMAATADAHSSVGAAARILDVDILPVVGDDVGRMTGQALRRALDDVETARVFAVVATAGTTNAGIVDELASVAEVCEQNDLWLHVDGAYGLAAMAAPSTRPLFAGIERADSFVVDPHKWLFAPYDCCALLYRDPTPAAETHSQFAGYLEQVDRADWNPSDYAIQLSRRARGLPFWFSLATYGTDHYAAAVERGLETTREVASAIEASGHLTLVMAPELSVILFERDGWDLDRMLEWSDHHARAGTILCLPTRWKGESVYRLCIISPDTSASRVIEALATME